jgi:hypothetical protein
MNAENVFGGFGGFHRRGSDADRSSYASEERGFHGGNYDETGQNRHNVARHVHVGGNVLQHGRAGRK